MHVNKLELARVWNQLVVLGLLSIMDGLLVDLGTKSIGRVSFNLNRLILESLVFAFYIMHIYISCETFYKDMIK